MRQEDPPILFYLVGVSEGDLPDHPPEVTIFPIGQSGVFFGQGIDGDLVGACMLRGQPARPLLRSTLIRAIEALTLGARNARI